MTGETSRWRGRAETALIAVPILSLLACAIAWLRFGIDLPFLDDYRAIQRETALSLDLKDLFTPANDTLYPVGMALDALAQRYLSGNSIAYQFLSMLGLLGGLLWVQWRMLAACVQDKLILAALFATCVFMIQPGSYWGYQNLAYHQGLPTLFILGAIAVIVDRRWSPRWGAPAVVVLSALAGLTYVSGAVAAMACGLALLAVAAIDGGRDRATVIGGAAMTLASIPTMAAQAWAIFSVAGGRIHDPAAAWALPYEADFWWFILGTVARTMRLQMDYPELAMALAFAVVMLALGLAGWAVTRLSRHSAPDDDNTRRTGTVFIATSAFVLAYLFVLSAGRANLRAPGADAPLAVFASAYDKIFHYFWVTPLLPWIAAMLYAALRASWPAQHRRLPSAAGVFAALMCFGFAMLGGFSHAEYFRSIEKIRTETEVRCLQDALRRGGEIQCARIYSIDFTPALRYARTIGASWTRYFPLPPTPLDANDPPPLFRLSTADPAAIQVAGVAPPTRSDAGYAFPPGDDPIVIIPLPEGAGGRCRELEVTAAISTESADTAELFALPKGQPNFAAPPAASAAIPGGGVAAELSLSARSSTGFEDRIRFDPVAGHQPVLIKDLVIRCPSPAPAP